MPDIPARELKNKNIKNEPTHKRVQVFFCLFQGKATGARGWQCLWLVFSASSWCL
jgi:hypothetical protein